MFYNILFLVCVLRIVQFFDSFVSVLVFAWLVIFFCGTDKILYLIL